MLRKVLLRGHIAAFSTVFAAELVLLSLGVAVAAGTSSSAVLPWAASIAGWVVRPAALVVLASGVALALTSSYGPRQGWIAIKLVIILALMGALFFGLVPGLERTLRDGGELGAATLLVASAIALSLLSVAVLLGLFKPFHSIARPAADGTYMHIQQNGDGGD
jgi:uncharacterized membrane protein